MTSPVYLCWQLSSTLIQLLPACFAERLVAALTQQLYCVPEGSGRGLRDAPYAAGDKVVEAAITIYKQQQVGVTQHTADPSVRLGQGRASILKRACHCLMLLLPARSRIPR